MPLSDSLTAKERWNLVLHFCSKAMDGLLRMRSLDQGGTGSTGNDHNTHHDTGEMMEARTFWSNPDTALICVYLWHVYIYTVYTYMFLVDLGDHQNCLQRGGLHRFWTSRRSENTVFDYMFVLNPTYTIKTWLETLHSQKHILYQFGDVKKLKHIHHQE